MREKHTCEHDAFHASRMILNKISDIVNGVAVRYPDAVAAGLVLGNLLEGEIRKAGEDGTWLKVLQKCTEGRAEGHRVAKAHEIKCCKKHMG